ncbi:MAG: HEAT repeat domain-containing protein, partial [Thermoguttaceae bacterium]
MIPRIFFTVLLLFAASTTFAQTQPETYTAEQITANFEQWLPDMSADDAEIAKREAAQQGWQKCCMYAGAPENAELRKVVNKLMTDQLGKDIPVTTKVWLLHELAWTGTADEVPAIAKLLDDPQFKIQDEAIRALATIPAEEAAAALKNAVRKDNEQRIKDALAFRAAKYNFDTKETTMPLAMPFVKEAEVEKWMQGYDKFDDFKKANTLSGLAARGDKKYNDKVVAALDSDDDYLKRSALFALEKLATPKEIAVIISKGKAIDEGITRRVLANNMSDGFEAALVKEMESSDSPDKTVFLAEVICNRYRQESTKPILTIAKKRDFPNRLSLMQNAEKIASKENIGDFIDAMFLLTDRGQRDSAEQIIVRLSGGDIDPVVAKMKGPAEVELLPLLGRIGGDDARKIVNKAVASSTANTHSAGIRALCNWPNAVVA